MVYRFIIQKRYHNLLRVVAQARDKNSYDIAKEVSMTPSHLCRVLAQWDSEGLLIREEKDGRANKIKLTKKGVEILFSLDTIDKISRDEKTQPPTKLEKDEELVDYDAKVDYDSRTKILTVKRNWKLSQKELKEEVKLLNQKKSNVLRDIKILKEEMIYGGELTPELKKLKENIESIGKIEKYEENKKALENAEKVLKGYDEELNQIKKAVGDRLKL